MAKRTRERNKQFVKGETHIVRANTAGVWLFCSVDTYQGEKGTVRRRRWFVADKRDMLQKDWPTRKSAEADYNQRLKVLCKSSSRSGKKRNLRAA